MLSKREKKEGLFDIKAKHFFFLPFCTQQPIAASRKRGKETVAGRERKSGSLQIRKKRKLDMNTYQFNSHNSAVSRQDRKDKSRKGS